MELAVAARPLRGRAVALLGRRPPMAHRPGASRPSRARLSRCLRSAPATRSSPAGARGAVAHPGPRGGRPAAPCPLSQEVERCRGALKFCSFLHPLSASPHLDNRSATSRKSTVWSCVSRKSTFCNPNTPTVTQSASFREGLRQNAPFRRIRLFLSGQTQCHLTERRTLLLRPHQKAHSATAAL